MTTDMLLFAVLRCICLTNHSLPREAPGPRFHSPPEGLGFRFKHASSGGPCTNSFVGECDYRVSKVERHTRPEWACVPDAMICADEHRDL